MTGAYRKMLKVDLSERRIEAVEISRDLWRNWLGGRGLGTKLLFDATNPGYDPLDNSAPLFIITSPLIGTLAPGTSKTAAVFKSPLAGAVSVSLCGGHLGAALRYAGWDAIMIQGIADCPSMLVIDDDRVSIKDASHLWGKSVGETSDWIRKNRSGDEVQWVVIGPAGEIQVKFASMHSGRGHEFGRGGGGAVLGSKRLKAIVIHGTGGTPVHDREKLLQLTLDAYKRLDLDPKARVRKRWGTLELVTPINMLGFWPTKNFQEGFIETADKIDADAFLKTVVIGSRSCHSCPVACGKVGKFKSPDGSHFTMEGPEFESLTLLGPNIGLDDFDSIAEATRLCDEFGVDTISMGNVLGAVMESAEKGILPKNLAGDLKISFSNPAAAFELIRRCCCAEGVLGKLMALGPAGFANEIGAPELAMAVKGLGLAAYDPRGLKGLGLTYATAAEGASHMRGPTMGPEIGGGKRLDDSNKAQVVIDCQVGIALADSAGLCSTARPGMPPAQMAEFLEAVTGENWTAEELLKIAKNVITLERRFNYREGFTRADDKLPKRFTEEPMPSGPSQGAKVGLDILLDEYYRLMGWDENGTPPP